LLTAVTVKAMLAAGKLGNATQRVGWVLGMVFVFAISEK
jgi:hypothetical protein